MLLPSCQSSSSLDDDSDPSVSGLSYLLVIVFRVFTINLPFFHRTNPCSEDSLQPAIKFDIVTVLWSCVVGRLACCMTWFMSGTIFGSVFDAYPWMVTASSFMEWNCTTHKGR